MFGCGNFLWVVGVLECLDLVFLWLECWDFKMTEFRGKIET
jgi:hypothetical protein